MNAENHLPQIPINKYVMKLVLKNNIILPMGYVKTVKKNVKHVIIMDVQNVKIIYI